MLMTTRNQHKKFKAYKSQHLRVRYVSHLLSYKAQVGHISGHSYVRFAAGMHR